MFGHTNRKQKRHQPFLLLLETLRGLKHVAAFAEMLLQEFTIRDNRDDLFFKRFQVVPVADAVLQVA